MKEIKITDEQAERAVKIYARLTNKIISDNQIMRMKQAICSILQDVDKSAGDAGCSEPKEEKKAWEVAIENSLRSSIPYKGEALEQKFCNCKSPCTDYVDQKTCYDCGRQINKREKKEPKKQTFEDYRMLVDTIARLEVRIAHLEKANKTFSRWLKRNTEYGNIDILTNEEIGYMFREWEKLKKSED